MLFSDFSRLFRYPFNFNINLSKGAKTTRQIWNLHSSAHDFDTSSFQQSSTSVITRKVFSSNLGHIGVLFNSSFISGIHFDGAYFSNHHIGWSLIGQDILSGSLIGTIISLTAGYFHMHSFCSSQLTSGVHLLVVLFVLFGLSSITCHGHCIHIAYPANGFLDAAIDPVVIPCLEDLLLKDCPEMLFGYPHVNESSRLNESYMSSILVNESSITERLLNHQTPQANELAIPYLSHPSLSINLLFPASNSILFGHHIYALPIYPYVRPDLLTVLCLVFRSWRFLIIGAFTRATEKHLSSVFEEVS